ncbi:hypothetical protein ELQ35_10775 [Peribacillus cavernae]|uniref:Uncharacterized protein n=1 Tax=Peribacillus cavernae TaxID=1674310 RepID=A0A3S0VYT5_9BACI|nr:hypothetical protein [Peribacillus cavernae]MDQ0221167.1 putative naringenin-chalcone synthase [Peribacillus cavernae]RUQ29092.1 hypothetical protein ELQ35_10775 [Peribacillus cavernae]
MSCILSVGTATPPHRLDQNETMAFAGNFFKRDFADIKRLLKVFENGQIETRYFAAPLEWFTEEHSLQEKNDRYIDMGLSISVQAIKDCLNNRNIRS